MPQAPEPLAPKLCENFVPLSLAVPMMLVDTRASQLSMYVALHVTQIHNINEARAVRPEHAMSVTATRSWVPLNIKHSDAVSRGLWGCEEM